MQGSDAEAQAELDSLRQERALLIDKLNNHPDVRKYAGRVHYLHSPHGFLSSDPHACAYQ